MPNQTAFPCIAIDDVIIAVNGDPLVTEVPLTDYSTIDLSFYWFESELCTDAEEDTIELEIFNVEEGNYFQTNQNFIGGHPPHRPH